MSTRNIHQQIDELQRERGQRAATYPSLVARGKLRATEAEEHNARLQAAIETLIWCRDNREAIAAAKRQQEQSGEPK